MWSDLEDRRGGRIRERCTIANTRHLPKHGPFSKEAGLNMQCARDATDIGSVDVQRGKDGRCRNRRGDPVPGVLVLGQSQVSISPLPCNWAKHGAEETRRQYVRVPSRYRSDCRPRRRGASRGRYLCWSRNRTAMALSALCPRVRGEVRRRDCEKRAGVERPGAGGFLSFALPPATGGGLIVTVCCHHFTSLWQSSHQPPPTRAVPS